MSTFITHIQNNITKTINIAETDCLKYNNAIVEGANLLKKQTNIENLIKTFALLTSAAFTNFLDVSILSSEQTPLI